MNRRVIINADDFGLSFGTNKAIETAFQKGILTSSSLFATTPGLINALKIIRRNPDLDIGIHLSLTWGKCVSKKEIVSDLVDSEGYFYSSYFRILLKSLINRQYVTQVENEFSNQIEKLLNLGVNVSHIDSQQHVHMIPNIYKVVIKLAKKYKIKYVRFTDENIRFVPKYPEIFIPLFSLNIIKLLLLKILAIKCVKTPRNLIKFKGVLYTTKINSKILTHELQTIKRGVTEILVHPAIYKINPSEKFMFDYRRQRCINFMKRHERIIEFKSLMDPAIKDLIKKNQIKQINFKELLIK